MGTKKILVVEKEAEVCQLLKRTLQQEFGVEVCTAQDGQEAMKVIEEGVPALVFLDLRLPGSDGFEILRRLRSQAPTRNTPVIGISAVADAREAALAEGCSGFIHRPFDLNLIVDEVKRHLLHIGVVATVVSQAVRILRFN